MQLFIYLIRESDSQNQVSGGFVRVGEYSIGRIVGNNKKNG
jgi:hypothetical protein